MNPSRLHFSIPSLLTILCLQFRLSASIDTRIVGGSEIDITEVPFMLSLRLDGSHICGATIISKHWALTAAHCVTTYKAPASNYSIRSGSTYKDKGGKLHMITRMIYHERYNDSTSDFDIAVLKVYPRFPINKRTRPIDLPGADYVEDDWAFVAGWGYYMYPGNVLSENLRYAEVPKVDRNECANDYFGRYVVTARQVCYGYRQTGVDSCKGDSGGPLYTEDKIIIGIISWGEDCAGEDSPGVYTTVFLMLDWIADKTGVRSRL